MPRIARGTLVTINKWYWHKSKRKRLYGRITGFYYNGVYSTKNFGLTECHKSQIRIVKGAARCFKELSTLG